VAHVPPNALELGFPAYIARVVFHRLEAANLDAGGPDGIVPRHAGAYLLVDGRLQVCAKLQVEILFQTVPADQGFESSDETPDPIIIILPVLQDSSSVSAVVEMSQSP
jgi:hypothetical protein